MLEGLHGCTGCAHWIDWAYLGPHVPIVVLFFFLLLGWLYSAGRFDLLGLLATGLCTALVGLLRTLCS